MNHLSKHVEAYPYQFFVESEFSEQQIQNEVWDYYSDMTEFGHEPILDSFTMAYRMRPIFIENIIARIVKLDENYDFGIFMNDYNDSIRQAYEVYGCTQTVANLIMDSSGGIFTMNQDMQSLLARDIDTVMKRSNLTHIQDGFSYSVIQSRELFSRKDIKTFDQHVVNMPIVRVW